MKKLTVIFNDSPRDAAILKSIEQEQQRTGQSISTIVKQMLEQGLEPTATQPLKQTPNFVSDKQAYQNPLDDL